MYALWLPPANEVCEGYVFIGVFLSIGGMSASGVSAIPPGRHPPLPGIQPPGRPPPGQTPSLPSACYHTVNKWVVCISLECILVTPCKGKKVMFSQVSVCPQSPSWLLVHCLALRSVRILRILLECFFLLIFRLLHNVEHFMSQIRYTNSSRCFHCRKLQIALRTTRRHSEAMGWSQNEQVWTGLQWSPTGGSKVWCPGGYPTLPWTYPMVHFMLPSPPWTDRHLWKYYLLGNVFANGKIKR